MAWTTLEDSSSTRPLDTLETFFKALADGGAAIKREHWAISLALRLQFPPNQLDLVPYLQRTWLLLRNIHPYLEATAASCQPNGPNETQIRVPALDSDEWVANTFLVHSEDEDSNSVFSTVRPSQTASCHWLPSTNEVVLHSSHWRIDGMGMMMLAHSFMTSLCSVLTLGLDVAVREYSTPLAHGQLTPSVDDIVQSHLDESTTPAHLRRAADQIVEHFVQGLLSIGLPINITASANGPGPSARTTIKFSAPTTALIVAACRQRGLHVASAVHASLIRTTARYPQHPAAQHYAAFIATDLRQYLPAPWVSTDFPVGLYVSGLPVCIGDVVTHDGKPQKGWDSLVKELDVTYRQNLHHYRSSPQSEQSVNVVEVVAPYVRRTTKLFKTEPPPGMPPVTTPDLSSLGVVENFLQQEYSFGNDLTVCVNDFWMGTEVLTPGPTLHVWTWKDELQIQACFNQHFWSKAFSEEVLGGVKDGLLSALNIEE